MLAGTEYNLRALNAGDNVYASQVNDETILPKYLSSEVDFIIVFVSGRLFYTGGYETAKSLRESIRRGDEIHGSYYGASAEPWQDTLILGSVESIIDIRTDTSAPAGEEEG